MRLLGTKSRKSAQIGCKKCLHFLNAESHKPSFPGLCGVELHVKNESTKKAQRKGCTVVCKIVRFTLWTKNITPTILFVCTKERKKEAGSLVLKPERPVDVDEERFAVYTMSERKSARRAPTPKRFSDEDVEKKPARKSTTTSTTKPGGGGGSKVRVFLPFRI